MNSSKVIKFATVSFGLALILGGCGSSSSNPPEGSGGSTQGSGGTSSTGSGWQTSSGGTTGSGGVTSTGGKVGSGGTTASGGATGSGGTSGSGGSTGSGGTIAATGGSSSGGASDSGGSAGGSLGSGGKGGAGSGGKAGGSGSGSGGASGSAGSSGAFALTSPYQADGAHFNSKFTCAAMNGTFGSGVNPELDWSGTPSGTMSFAITFIDTSIGADKAMGQHWAIWNIPPAVMKFAQGTTMVTGDLMGAVQNGKFLAPCAGSPATGPNNMDLYTFTVYALPAATLNVGGSKSVADALAALKMVQPLATATLTGTAGPMGK